MKEVSYTFEVMDFCPEKCEAFSPIRVLRDDKFRCLHTDSCKELHRVLQMHAELDRILENAGGASPAPTKETEVLK